MNCELGDGRGDIVSTAGNRFGASWQGVSRGGVEIHSGGTVCTYLDRHTRVIVSLC